MPPPPFYQHSIWEKIKVFFVKNIPFWFNRILQFLLYFLYNAIRFVGQIFREAIGK